MKTVDTIHKIGDWKTPDYSVKCPCDNETATGDRNFRFLGLIESLGLCHSTVYKMNHSRAVCCYDE